VRTAASAANTLFIPLSVPSNSEYRAGSKILSVDLFYKVGTAALANLDVVALKKQALPANGTAFAGADVAETAFKLDAGHDTEAERTAEEDHTLTVTFDPAVYVDNDEVYYLVVTIEGAATSAFTLFGARINYELRL